ncbi:glycosyltransferase [Patescibacteria group bacterium]|nr:glycosyltransferase [Patescibacteria group bacterium]
MKKILYLGGCFQAEFSMARSFRDAGNQFVAYIDPKAYEAYWAHDKYIQNGFIIPDYLKWISQEELQLAIELLKPDVVIHRLYQYNPMMHSNSLTICKKLGIPFVYYKIETSGSDDPKTDTRLEDADLILYAHNCNDILINELQAKGKKTSFYPYGVSNFEHSMPEIKKTINVAAFGHIRDYDWNRTFSLSFFLRGLQKIGEPLHVFGNWTWTPWIEDFHKWIVVHPPFRYDEATRVMNQCKVAINFETLHNVEGAYSHKMFQTIGCGVPTLTIRKESVIDLLRSHTIIVRDPIHVSRWVDGLIHNGPLRYSLGRHAERYIHEKLDWWSRFDKIMKVRGIW